MCSNVCLCVEERYLLVCWCPWRGLQRRGDGDERKQQGGGDAQVVEGVGLLNGPGGGEGVAMRVQVCVWCVRMCARVDGRSCFLCVGAL